MERADPLEEALRALPEKEVEEKAAAEAKRVDARTSFMVLIQ
jgi:hypothetical protein